MSIEFTSPQQMAAHMAGGHGAPAGGMSPEVGQGDLAGFDWMNMSERWEGEAEELDTEGGMQPVAGPAAGPAPVAAPDPGPSRPPVSVFTRAFGG